MTTEPRGGAQPERSQGGAQPERSQGGAQPERGSGEYRTGESSGEYRTGGSSGVHRTGGSSGEHPATYETAAARIEEIIKRLDSGDAGLRETLELVKEGRRLVELCAAELEAVGRGLEELRLDELIARLEAGNRDAPPPGAR